MLVKCICSNCSGHLEFEEENAGEQIKCPHCGWETTLQADTPGSSEQIDEGILDKLKRHWRGLAAVSLLVLFLGAVSFTVYRWVFPRLQEMFPSLEGPLMLVLTIAVIIWICLAVILWTLLPLILYLQLKEMPIPAMEETVAEDQAAASRGDS